MSDVAVSISSFLIMQRLQFMTLFIAVYESFEDHILECPKNFLDGGKHISRSTSDYKKLCEEEVKRQRSEKRSAKRCLLSAKNKGIAISENDDVYIRANYDYQKITTDGFTKWLSPAYDARIAKRLLELEGRKQTKPNVLLNSLMFFRNITENDLGTLQAIKDKRNQFAHNMAELLITDVFNPENSTLFDNLVNLYIRVNNCWCVEYGCVIADDVPENADYKTIITVKMYNLLSAIDALTGSNHLAGKNYRHYIGLYEGLMIPIKKGVTCNE